MSKLTTLVAATLATLTLSLVAVPTASAGHWWYWDGGIFHLHEPHRPAIPFFNWADEHGDMRTRCEYARGNWSANPVIDMYNVGSFAQAHITCEDGYWGRTDWLGLAVHEGPYDYNGRHYTRMRAWNNLTFLAADPAYNTWQYRQAVACQEVGHGLGMLHAGPGCMGVGYGTSPYAAGSREPSGHDHEHVNWLYSGLH